MGIRRFALVAGHDVFTVIAIDESMDGSDGLIAGLMSQPIVVETNIENVNIGWKYADGEFWAPAKKPEGPGYELDD